VITPEIVKKALSTLHNSSDYIYFFNKLSKVAWVPHLINEGYFKSPPELIKSKDGAQIPFWAESGYLARVADQDPRLVMDAIKSIPITDNSRVHHDYVDFFESYHLKFQVIFLVFL